MYIYFKFLLIIFKHTEKYKKWYKLSDLIITMNNKENLMLSNVSGCFEPYKNLKSNLKTIFFNQLKPTP